MKTTFLSILLLASISGSLLSCSTLGNNGKDTEPSVSAKDTSSDVYASLIIQLQDKLEKLEAEQSAADSENDKKLDELKNSIDSLNSQTESDTGEESTSETEKPPVEPHFTYTTEGNSATITGYTGTETHLVIPAVIDGYTVTGIADNAFQASTLQSVIISNGIQKIGWFAFQKCESLQSLTVPTSVQSIGYSAFSGVSEQFTIYCPEGSFAWQYAQSYGLRSAVI